MHGCSPNMAEQVPCPPCNGIITVWPWQRAPSSERSILQLEYGYQTLDRNRIQESADTARGGGIPSNTHALFHTVQQAQRRATGKVEARPLHERHAVSIAEYNPSYASAYCALSWSALPTQVNQPLIFGLFGGMQKPHLEPSLIPTQKVIRR